jgi:hypothetical protein
LVAISVTTKRAENWAKDRLLIPIKEMAKKTIDCKMRIC